MIAKFKKKKRQSKPSLISAVFLGVLVLVVIGFLVVSNLRINQRRSVLTSQLEDLRQQLQVLQERKAYLEGKISESAHQDFLEKEGRERFNLKKPGEEVVTILPPEEKGEETEKEKGFWEKILGKLKI